MSWEGHVARMEGMKICTVYWRGKLKEGHHKEGLGLIELYSSPPLHDFVACIGRALPLL